MLLCVLVVAIVVLVMMLFVVTMIFSLFSCRFRAEPLVVVLFLTLLFTMIFSLFSCRFRAEPLVVVPVAARSLAVVAARGLAHALAGCLLLPRRARHTHIYIYTHACIHMH